MRRDAWHAGHDSLPSSATNGTLPVLVSKALPTSATKVERMIIRFSATSYQSAADILDIKPAEIMMVAAHSGDLRAAKDVGLRTAFVTRPLEYGPNGKPDLKADSPVDISARDFNDLASQLGA